MKKDNWKITWFTRWEEILNDDFFHEWNSWIENAHNPHVFYHPVMGKIWIETYLPLRNIQPLFCLADQGDIKIFMPLVLWRRNWKNAFLKHVVPLGYSDYDYHDPIIVGTPSQNQLDYFWSVVFHFIDTLNIDLIDISGIHGENRSNAHQWSINEECPFIDIADFDTINSYIEQKFTHKEISEIKRRKKRLSEIGELEFVTYSHQNVTEAVSELPEFHNEHRSRWPNAYNPPSLHKNILEYGLPEGFVHFSTVKLSEMSISWRLGFVYDHRYYSYIPAFKSDFKKYGIGKLHLLYCIEQAIAYGCTIYDQLRGAEEYKQNFSTGFENIYRITIKKSSFKSNVKSSAMWLKEKVVI